MKLYFIFLIPSVMFGQIGVNNDNPSALLDIIKTSNKSSILITNKASDKIIEIDTNNNLFLKGALLINNNNIQNPGKPGQVLVSKGDGIQPEWLDVNKSVISNYMTSLLFGSFNPDQSRNIKKENTEYALSFTNNELINNTDFNYIIPSLNTSIDNTSIGYNLFTVQEEGVYQVVINGFIDIENINNSTNGLLTLNLGDYSQLVGSTIVGNKLQFIIQVIKKLEANQKIYTTINSNSSWRFSEFDMLITYVNSDY